MGKNPHTLLVPGGIEQFDAMLKRDLHELAPTWDLFTQVDGIARRYELLDDTTLYVEIDALPLYRGEAPPHVEVRAVVHHSPESGWGRGILFFWNWCQRLDARFGGNRTLDAAMAAVAANAVYAADAADIIPMEASLPPIERELPDEQTREVPTEEPDPRYHPRRWEAFFDWYFAQPEETRSSMKLIGKQYGVSRETAQRYKSRYAKKYGIPLKGEM